MIADTRTNAGVDNISTFRKLTVLEQPGDYALAIAAAGSLSVTQSALSMMQEGLLDGDTGQIETLGRQGSLFHAAQFAGRALGRATEDVKAALADTGVSYGATLLLGGQMAGGPLRLFMIYGAGNFIECGEDAPFLQIGEHKYGKPILDRSLKVATPVDEALKLGLLSFDATIRSNLAVGAPLDIAVIRRDALAVGLRHRVEPDEPYFRSLCDRWSDALETAQRSIPHPPYGAEFPAQDPPP